jgi:hypothetical protein
MYLHITKKQIVARVQQLRVLRIMTECNVVYNVYNLLYVKRKRIRMF